MRSYWLRILLGRPGHLRHRHDRRHDGPAGPGQGGRRWSTGTGPLTIPLPFVPFQLDGNKLGTVEHLVVNREAPKKVSSVELR